MEAFENSFRIGYDYYIRYFDGNQSKIKKIPSFNERYVEDTSGDFTYFLNPEIKLRRITRKTDLPVYGNYKPDLCYIRDFYWQKNYNKSPRYWFLDIETTAKRSVDTKSFPETIVCIQIYDSKTNTVIVFSLTDFVKGIDYTESESGNYTFNGEVFDFKLKYFKLNSEAELILAFFKLINLRHFLLHKLLHKFLRKVRSKITALFPQNTPMLLSAPVVISIYPMPNN